MNRYTVCILSDNLSNAWECTSSVIELNGAENVIVGCNSTRYDQFHKTITAATVQPLSYPFSFARLANRLIRGYPFNDIVLLNDDAILKSTEGFQRLREATYHYPEYGILSAAIEGAGKRDQKPAPFENPIVPRESKDLALSFVCVYIRREIFERVGLLDERFGPEGYGFEDNDYCERVRRAGWKLGILDSCIVNHGSLPSSYRSEGNIDDRLLKARATFQSIWGEETANLHFPQCKIPGIPDADVKVGVTGEKRRIIL